MTDRTNAERQRRYIARLKAQAAKAGVTNAGSTEARAAEPLRATSATLSKLEAELGRECKRREAAEAEVVALKAELARAKPASSGHDALVQELAQAKARAARAEMGNVGLRRALAEAERKLAKPKVEKPPLPPDEARERAIKGLRTRVRNLTIELHAMREWERRAMEKLGHMDFQTMSAIAKVLHPDHEPSAAERDTALKLFTAWKADNSKARRRA